MEKRRDDVTTQSVAIVPGGAALVWPRMSGVGPGKRPFSALEAWIYERFIAAAARDVVVPVIAPLIRGHAVLDVGCGGGLITAALEGVAAVGVDPALVQARRARGIAASADHLPFA